MANRVSPLVRELADKLRRFLLTECEPSQKLPTEVQLSRTYGRSVVTVRKALAMLSKEGLLFRRRGSGTYAGADLPRITGATGVLTHSAAHQFLRYRWMRESFEGIIVAASEVGRHVQLIFGKLDKPYIMPEDAARRIVLGHMDSIICVDIFDEKLFRELSRRMVTVSLDLACAVAGVSSCALRHEQTLDLAVEHLWRLGHRRLSLVGDLPRRGQDPAAHLRRRGFLTALGERGLPVGQNGIIDLSAVPRTDKIERNQGWTRRWSRTPPAKRATALVVMDFWDAAYWLLRLGARVPEDVSVIALGKPDPVDVWLDQIRLRAAEHAGDSPPAAQRIDPEDRAATALRNLRPVAVDLPFAQMGRWAMAEVIRRTEQPDAPPRHATFPGTMIPGNTAAPPPPQV